MTTGRHEIRRHYRQRPGRRDPEQRASSYSAKRVCDHCDAATGKLHRDRAWCEQHRWSCPGGSVRSFTLLETNSEAHLFVLDAESTTQQYRVLSYRYSF